MLEVKELSKKFKDTVVVDKLSFNVNKGEIVGLLGENGAGKTTTPIDFKKLNTLSDIRNEKISFIFQNFALIKDLTVIENVILPLKFRRIPLKSRRIVGEKYLKELGIESLAKASIRELSGGQQQRVAIARALAMEPDVMLFDEPSTGLDVRATRVVHEFIKKCKEENKTILFSSHSMAEVEKLCDRVIIIHKGKLVEQGRINELKEKYNTEDLEEVFISLIGGDEDE